LTQGYNDEFGSKMIEEKINGSGTGECLGVRNSGVMITVAKESGQAADTIVSQNISKMVSRLHGGMGLFMANPSVLPALTELGASSTIINIWTQAW